MSSGSTPREPAIARSEQLRERLAGMRVMVEGFSSELLAEIQMLRDEMQQQEGAGHVDDAGASH